MINGHGDDLFAFDGKIEHNFSSNVYSRLDLTPLKDFLAGRIDCLDSYPEPEPTRLERRISDWIEVPHHNVMVTAGATDAIYNIAQAWTGCHSCILQPTFSEYADACRINRHRITNIGDIADIPDDVDMIWICNPNNPTGKVIPRDTIFQMAKYFDGVPIVIDQAYEDYTEEELIHPRECIRLENVILLKSLTKRFAVPGLRVGYMIGHKRLIYKVKSVRKPWSVSTQAIDGGIFLINHASEFQIPTRQLIEEANRVMKELQDFGIFPYNIETSTNFFLARLPFGQKACDLKKYLAENFGILIRDASNFHGLFENHFRIAVQTPEENDLLINAIKSW